MHEAGFADGHRHPDRHAPTATPSPAPNGGSCTTSADCASRNRVDDVCEPMQPVPATSTRGLVVAMAILIALGGLGVWRAQHRMR